MTNTIPNVPRELKPCPFCGDIPSENSHALTDGGFKYGAIQCGCGALGPDVRTEYKDWPHWRDAAFAAWNERALLSAPSPAGVDGLEVVGWYRMDDRKAITPYPSVCATWHKMGVKVGAAYSDSAQAIIDGLRGEVAELHTTMMAAAVEIQEHWAAHCDEEGYGPANLMHRLERGIASQYGYSAETLVRLESQRDQQAQRIGELEGLLLRVQVSLSLDDTEWGYSGAEKYKLLADIRAAMPAGKNSVS